MQGQIPCSNSVFLPLRDVAPCRLRWLRLEKTFLQVGHLWLALDILHRPNPLKVRAHGELMAVRFRTNITRLRSHHNLYN